MVALVNVSFFLDADEDVILGSLGPNEWLGEALTRPPPGQAASPPQKSPLTGVACLDAGE